MDGLKEICEILNKYDRYLMSELKEPTDKNVSLYENWIECKSNIEEKIKEIKDLG